MTNDILEQLINKDNDARRIRTLLRYGTERRGASEDNPDSPEQVQAQDTRGKATWRKNETAHKHITKNSEETEEQQGRGAENVEQVNTTAERQEAPPMEQPAHITNHERQGKCLHDNRDEAPKTKNGQRRK